MRKKTIRSREGNGYFAVFKQAAKEKPGVFWTYLILRLIVLGTLVRSVMRGDAESVFICLLVLVIFTLPHLIERRFDIEIPSALEIIIFVFVFAAEILGELGCYFIRYPHWDTLLHTTSGFLWAALGFSLADLLNRSERVKVQLSPFYVALMAFCFSMTVGVIWEFIEFAADRILLLDMQKDTIVHTISSVALDTTNSNSPVVITGITDASVNGTSLGLGGYLDIGLYDTMEDLFVNFVGAVVFAVIGYNEEKSEKRWLTEKLLPHRRRHAASPTGTETGTK